MSNYRDDRDALREKAEALSTELQDARADLQEKEAALGKKDAEIARLRRLTGERPPTRSGNRVAMLVAVSASLAVLGGVVSFTLMRSAPAPAPIPAMPLPVEARPGTASTDRAKTVASFPATVTSVLERKDVTVGQRCDVRVVATGTTSRDKLEDVTITCDGHVIYALTNRMGSVTSMTSWTLGTTTDDDHFAFRFEDVGARTSDARSQLTLSSEQGTARLFDDAQGTRREVVFSLKSGGRRVPGGR